MPGKVTLTLLCIADVPFITKESTVAPELSRDCCATGPYDVSSTCEAFISCPMNFSTSSAFSISNQAFACSNCSPVKPTASSCSIASGPSSCTVSRLSPCCFNSAALIPGPSIWACPATASISPSPS